MEKERYCQVGKNIWERKTEMLRRSLLVFSFARLFPAWRFSVFILPVGAWRPTKWGQRCISTRPGYRVSSSGPGHTRGWQACFVVCPRPPPWCATREGCRMLRGPQSEVGAPEEVRAACPSQAQLTSTSCYLPTSASKGIHNSTKRGQMASRSCLFVRRSCKVSSTHKFLPSCLPQNLLKCKCNRGGKNLVNKGWAFSNLTFICLCFWLAVCRRTPRRE